MLPAIAISYVNRVPGETFADFQHIVATEGLDFRIEAREEDGPFASLEWLIPTAVVLFIGKAYFESFLKEMGKDHYVLLKEGLKSLHKRLIGPDAPRYTVVSTAGKASSDQPYSLLFSLLAEGEGVRFKLLIRRDATAAEYEATVNAFLAFLDAYHHNILSEEGQRELESSPVVGKTMLLAYNPTLKRVQPLDPLPKQGAHET